MAPLGASLAADFVFGRSTFGPEGSVLIDIVIRPSGAGAGLSDRGLKPHNAWGHDPRNSAEAFRKFVPFLTYMFCRPNKNVWSGSVNKNVWTWSG